MVTLVARKRISVFQNQVEKKKSTTPEIRSVRLSIKLSSFIVLFIDSVDPLIPRIDAADWKSIRAVDSNVNTCIGHC